ncbi:MAG: hypothetical protein OXC66_07625 [Roseovarius sp.]|nr:hypothetical protein [Roseovarius sp.]
MLLNRILGRIGGHGFHPSSETFPTINLDLIGKSLRLEKRGVGDAKAGMPKSDAKGFSQVEHEVINRVGELRKRGLDHYEMQIHAYANRIRGAHTARNSIEVAASQFVTQFEIDRNNYSNYLTNSGQLVKGSYEKLEAYRNKHGTIGPPNKAKNTVLMLGIILIVFVIEVVLSGTLFSQKNEMGLIGGMGVAIIISGVNVLACLLCGLGTRYHNLKSFGSKIFGSLAFLLFLGILAGLNLTVAHFRDALALYEWENAAFQAIISLRENVLGIDSFNSWVVAALGGIVSIVAFIEGLIWYDRHPGFNRIYSEAEQAVISYANEYEQAQKQLRDSYNMARDELQEHAQRMRANIQSAADAVGNQSTLTRSLRSFLESCDQDVNHLLARYRDANTKTRSDQRPKYFDNKFSFEEYSIPEKPNIDTKEAKAEVKKVDKIVEQGVKDILLARKEAISAFPKVNELREDFSGEPTVNTSNESSFKKNKV